MPKKLDYKFAEELFKKYRQMMFKIAYGILHNKSDSEDVVQEIFLWILNNLEKVSQLPCNKKGSYFAKAIERSSLNLISKQKRHILEDIDKCEEVHTNTAVDKESVDKITIEEIKQVIRAMSERDRLILRLYLFEEKSYEDIAEIAGISEGNARVCVHRARKRLAKLLKEKGIDYEY